MDFKDAEILGLSLMSEHHLLSEGWVFGFDNAIKRAGVCRYDKQEISLSRYFVAFADEDEVEQLILHEIAHSILPAEIGHSYPWKVMAKAIGYRGGRVVRNPYLEAHVKAGILPSRLLPINELKQLPKGHIPEVEIGSVLTHSGKYYTVFKKAKNRWHARSPHDPRVMMVSFEGAPLYLANLA